MNLDPKVNEPFEQIPRRITRAAMVDKIRLLFHNTKIEDLLKSNGIDFSNREINKSTLDLKHFDDRIFDIYPNEIWMKKAFDPATGKQLRLLASALFIDKNRKLGVWKKVIIISYDAQTDMFSGHTDDSEKIPFTKSKIYVLFDAENPFVYCRRLISALKLRELADNKIKYNFYISNIPKYDINGLPDTRIQKIVNKVSSLRDFNLISEEAEKELDKINQSYITCLNKIMFDDLLFKKKTSELNYGNLKLEPDPVEPVPYIGKEKVYDYNMKEMVKNFKTKFILCKKNIVEILQEIKLKCHFCSNNMSIYKVNLKNTLRVDDFRKEQKRQFTRFKQQFDNEIIGYIKKILKETSVKKATEETEFEIDFIVNKIEKKRKPVFEEERRKEKYMDSLMTKINELKTKNFVTLINTIIKDTLFNIVCNSLIRYIHFFENLIPVQVTVNNTNSVGNKFEPNYFSKIKNIAKSKTVLDSSCAFKKATDAPDQDLNTTIDIVEHEESEEELHKFPIFHISLKYRDGEFEYNYKLEELITEIKTLFDEGMDKIKNIPIINFMQEKSSSGVVNTRYYDVLYRNKNRAILTELMNPANNNQTSDPAAAAAGEANKAAAGPASSINSPNATVSNFNSQSLITKKPEAINTNNLISSIKAALMNPLGMAKDEDLFYQDQSNFENQKEDFFWVSELYERLHKSLLLGKEPLDKFLESFQQYKEYLEIVPEQYVKKFEEDGDPNLVVKIRDEIIRSQKLKDKILQEISPEIHVSFFLVNCKDIREYLLNIFDKIYDLLIEILSNKARDYRNSIHKQCDDIKKEIAKTGKNIDELVLIEKNIEEVPHTLENLKVDIEACMNIYRILDDFQFKTSSSDLRTRWFMVVAPPTEILNSIQAIKNSILKQRAKFAEELTESQVKLKEEIATLEKNQKTLFSFDNISNLHEAAQLAKNLEATFQDCKEKARIYNKREVHFEREETNYSCIADMYKEFEPFYQIWTNIDTFLTKSKLFLTSNLSTLKGEEVKNMNENVLKMLAQSIRKLKEREGNFTKIISTAEEIRKRAEEFKPIANLAVHLTTEGMEERHWQELKEKTTIDCSTISNMSLNDILMNCDLNQEILHKTEEIADKAFREHQINIKIKLLEEKWKAVNFLLLPYRNTGTFTVGGWGDIYAVLDEDVLEVQQLEMSQFKGVFAEQISEWYTSLMNITVILEEWTRFQKKWMQLQPIFDSSDIHRSIPAEAKKFKTVNETWRDLIKALKENSNVKHFCNRENLIDNIKTSNTLLEEVERGLNDYIDKKKTVFPRFYFISQEDLIEIISQTKDLNKIKDNLKKIFDNIHFIELKDDRLITKILSQLQESVNLREPVLIHGRNVEIWMLDLESKMFETVKYCLERAVEYHSTQPKSEWIFGHSGQSIIHSQQIFWTQGVEDALTKKTVVNYITTIQERINFLVTLMRGSLNRINSITISNLITNEVHNKEVTQGIYDNNIQDMSSFEWIKQLRYYWENNNCQIKSIQTSFPYGYEYMGNQEILVITPLTDKCYLTLMGALKMNMGGAPAGPAGTGKTESTKDLAKAIAKHCIVYNCSEQIDFTIIAKFFKGLACCGSWICFDEFNRINVEVLSVIAQQLNQLFSAKEKGEKEIIFEKSQIKILPTFCVFITMNPDYEGRSSLPDNLQALFRPMAMMVPDYKLISEVYLYSSGYLMAKDMAKKIVSTFKLSSEQLSSQSHYDFGMRSVKSVLYAAKKLKRAAPDVPEDKLLLRALEDVNVPKFLKEDIPLFKNIIKDLFPTTERPKSDLDNLVAKIKQNCINKNLQPHEAFVGKVIQLYDTIQVRHGLMIVGPAGGGKTKNWNILKKSISDLNDGSKFFPTESIVINPKSIRKEQLYCELDKNTNEWTNGIIPLNIIKINGDTTGKNKYWIILDGPVDTLWIEDMNSVLDDSRKLCLTSSAIITLNEAICMMFEVEDLLHASPATVSRCGMVYMEPDALGLLPVVDSWLNTIPTCLIRPNLAYNVQERLKELFYNTLEESVRLVRKKLKEPCPTTNNMLAHSLMRILDCLLEKYKEKENMKVSEFDIEILYKSLAHLFFFGLIWTVGITTNEEGRIKFSEFVRESIVKENVDNPDLKIPEEGLVYDYFYDAESDQWNKWEKLLTYPSIDQRALFTDIMIPTIDSVRYSYILKLLMLNNKHVITSGPTGTGKTVNISEILSRELGDKYVSLVLNFSAQTSASQTQDTIDGKVKKKTRTKYAPENNKTMIIFVDDLNMPKKEKYDAQPPIELLRQWLDHEGWYDHKDKERPFMNIVDILYCGAMGPPGGSRSQLSNRFMRHFNLITYTELSDSSIKAIFSRKVSHFLNRFSEAVKDTIPTIINSSISLYKEIKQTLLPTPKNSHYLFNLRDMAKALQGLCSSSPRYLGQKIDILRLWLHEMTRAFGDRLICDEDRKWLKDLLDNNIFNEFAVDKTELYNVEKIIFCDFIAGADKPFIQVTNIKQFITKIEENLINYNEESKGKPMRLVMFLDACDHVARICRIIRQTQGHALLLGVGGSGRQSLARLSSYINGNDCFQIEVNKGYSMSDFKKNLKDCLKEAGLKEKPLCFLICDTQIFSEQILEDLNNCLNSGDVPEIYKSDDLDEIKAACKSECSRRNLPETPTNIFNVYLSKVRTNIHLMIAMSPMSEEFVTRIRMFPSLVNCCTIDWFTEWPDEALLSVAQDSIEKYDLRLGENLNPVVQSIKYIHKSVESLSKDFLNELRRYNYLTPTSFLEFLLLFKNILEQKRNENEFNINRLETGLTVLEFAGKKIENIEKEIKEKQPKLERTTIEVNEYIVVLSSQKEEADKVKEVATEEKKNAEELNKKITEINDICKRELSKAEDQLKKSLLKIENIDETKLLEIGRLSNCSQKMEKLLELLLIFKTGNGYKNKKANFIQTGDHKNPLQLSILTAAKNDLLITSVQDFKGYFYSFQNVEVRDKLKTEDLYKVKMAEQFIEENKIDREYAERAAGAIVACFDFVLAMSDFCYNSINVVDPKKKEAEKTQKEKMVVDEKLRKAEEELRVAEDKANKLERTYNEKVKEKNDLAFELSENQTKLERAKALVGLLSSEKQRWGENVETLKKYSALVIGDCLIAAAMIAYSGAFTAKYRTLMEENWKKKLEQENILKSSNASLRSVMEDKLQTRKWNLNLLPNDNLSIENGIIMFRTRKWPLMIDPQNQASIFLKKYGNSSREGSFIHVKYSDPKMIDQVISGVKFGQWIMLDNVGTYLDTSLEPILLQQKIKKGNYCEIKIGDKLIPYNEEFKLFMITTLSNPHYSPETFAKITIINFAITPFGLEDQMLSELVKIEMPELEESKNKILEENFKSQEILKEIEDKILDNLSKNRNSIEETLKSSDLIDILTEAKTKSKEINEKLVLSEKTGKEIDIKRELYRPSAKRASILFFILLDLSFIDSMYQYSLTHFKRLFENTVRMLNPCDDLDRRIIDINRKFSKDFYDNTCRSLFEKDKILFSFVMAVKIIMGEKNEDVLSPVELRFLLAGPSGDLEFHLPDNPTKWISSTDWRSFYSQIHGMSLLHPNFQGFEDYFMKHHDRFKAFYESPKNEITPLPEQWNDKLTDFQKLIVIKAVRNDKLIFSLINYVESSIGKEFTEPPPFDLNASLKETNYTIPLLFILSTGSDPINDLKSLAESYGRKIEFVSLGKSMDKIAISKIEDVKLKGGWIILQNCHLSLSFLPKLEDIIEQLQNNTTTEPNFRLWLTSMSSPHFSINISKLSVKITMEPPKGLKLNLQRQFNNIRDEDLEACAKPELFKSFFFAMCFFHAIVQDRRKFGPIGWNVKYDFTNEDLIVSRKQLKNFLEEYDFVPYKVLNYLGAEINYGGRITDDKDQRLIRTIFSSYINENILKYEDYKFSQSGIYYCNRPGRKADYLEYIKGLPLITSPEVFGLHENAEITTAQNEASLLLETVLGMQPRSTYGAGKSVEQIIKELLVIIEKDTPPVFDYEAVFAKYQTEYKESMNTVLIQEVIRYNVLLSLMQKHIKTLKKALSGKIVMSDEMERIAISLYNNQVPQIWIKLGFLSLKPLMSWLLDLKERIEFFTEWIDKGTPKAFCLPSKSFIIY